MISSIHKTTIFFSFIFSFFLFTATFAHGAPRIRSNGQPQLEYSYQLPKKIGDGLEISSLYKEGIDPAKIDDLMLAILAEEYRNIHSVLLVKNGYLVLEEYFYGYNRKKLHQIRSATKSIGSVLTGIAIDHGFIKDTSESIYRHFKLHEPKDKWDDRVKNITLKSLITMTSGYDCDDHESDFKCERNMNKSNDWFRYALDLPMAYNPGEHWAYNSSSLILVGELISKTSGMTIPDFANKYLFEPLGIKIFQWGFSPKGRAWLAGNAKMTPRDMAKFGYLILNKGIWDKKQIVSQEWVEASIEKHAVSRVGWGYGYLWWLGETIINNKLIKAFWAAGNGGNYIFILPSLNVVTVFTGGNYGTILEVQCFSMLINYLIPSILPSPKKIIQIDGSLMDNYVGEYRNIRDENIYSVFREGDNLYINIPYEKNIKISPETQNQFYGTSNLLGDLLIHFSKSENGSAGNMNIQIALMKIQTIKIE